MPTSILKSSSLPDLISLSKPGVFFIRNSSKKRIDIRTGVNILLSLQKIIKEGVDGFLVPKLLQRDLINNQVEIGILEVIKDKPTQNIRLAYWVDYYRNLGYTFYRNKNQFPVKYKVKKEYTVNNSDDTLFSYTVQVSLNHSKNKVVVGVFYTDQEAEAFIEENYQDKIFSFIYKDNELTKAYYKKKNKGFNKAIKLKKI